MPRAVVEFQHLLAQLSADLGSRTGRLLSRLGRSRLTAHEIRVFVTDAYPELARPFLWAAAELAAQWYAEQPVFTIPGATVFVPTPIVLTTDDQLGANARWGTTQESPEQAMQGSSERVVFDAARDTVTGNADLEPGTRWARYASANACGFCRLLATRGDVYRSEASATSVVGRSVNLTVSDRRAVAAGHMTEEEAIASRSVYRSERAAKRAGRSVGDQLASLGTVRGTRELGAKFHDHCHCIAVPVRPGDAYMTPSYMDQWEQDYNDAIDEARADGKVVDFKEICRRMDAKRRS